MNKGSIVERLCSDLIAKSRDINGLLYFTFTRDDIEHQTDSPYPISYRYSIPTKSASPAIFEVLGPKHIGSRL